jgi:hypothetical protein
MTASSVFFLHFTVFSISYSNLHKSTTNGKRYLLIASGSEAGVKMFKRIMFTVEVNEVSRQTSITFSYLFPMNTVFSVNPKQHRQDRLLVSKASKLVVGPIQPLLNQYQGNFLLGYSMHVLKLTTQIYLVPHSEDILGSEGMTRHIHVSTPQLLYPMNPLDGRLSGPQSLYGFG